MSDQRERREDYGVSHDSFESFQRDFSRLERRVTSLDGNGIDPEGGRVGRVENTLSKLVWLGVGILISSLGTCIMMIARFMGAK